MKVPGKIISILKNERDKSPAGQELILTLLDIFMYYTPP